MSMMNMPVPMSKEDLLAVLDDIRQGVESGDTLEGSIEFLLPYPGQCPGCRGSGKVQDSREYWIDCIRCGGSGMGPEPEGDFEVRASYRIGNSMGQGGVRMIGEMREVPER